VDHDLERLLILAKAGEGSALGELLQRYDNYLKVLARVGIDQRLQGKVDPSDLVQETYLEAHRDFANFRGSGEPELAAWLRQILAHNLANAVRHFAGTQARDVRLEQQLQADLDRSSQAWDPGLVARSSSPSHQAARREQMVLIADALARLSPDYREVLILRHLQGLTFPEVARRMERSLTAINKLWVRALDRLKEVLGGQP
jgi:RNA polymerase sigma-70 factor (ECF subfamily)